MSENILEKQLFEIIKNKEMAEHIKLAKIDMLVRLGVDVNAMYGAKSLLKLANEVKEEKIAKFLEEKGAKEFFDEEKAEELGQELLKECGQKEINFEKVKELINKGADIEAKDEEGQTSLMWASHRGHGVVVKLLLEKGANVDAKSLSGKTALDWADSDKIKKMLNEAKNKNSFFYKVKKGFGIGD